MYYVVFIYIYLQHKKFLKVSDIPKEFVKKNVCLRGEVIMIEESHLRIDHLPILNLQRFIRRLSGKTVVVFFITSGAINTEKLKG